MLEALAAATILASKWDRQSPFVNPMCGSATLAIEAALVATKRKPGACARTMLLCHVLGYDESLYKEELRNVRAQVTEIPELKIIATDNRQGAIDISKVNAGIAGVDQYIKFKCCDFTETRIPKLRVCCSSTLSMANIWAKFRAWKTYAAWAISWKQEM